MSNLVWSWRNAAFGAVMSSVAVVVILFGDVGNGLNLLLGAIPAAILGLPPHREDRRRVMVIGVLFAVSVLIGSILAQWAAVAVVGMFLMGLGAALLATRRLFGYAVLTICLPLAGTGLTYDGLDESAGVSALFLTGSAIAFVGALCFPEYDAPAPVSRPLLTIAAARDYGVRLGLAAAVGTAIGFYYGAEHTGWIVISTLLVMRPAEEMLKIRSAGRADISVHRRARRRVAAHPGSSGTSNRPPRRWSNRRCISDQRQSVVHHSRIHDVPDLVVDALRRSNDREHRVPLVGTSSQHAARCWHCIFLRAPRSDTHATSCRCPLGYSIGARMTGCAATLDLRIRSDARRAQDSAAP